jgi:hypothetical protein
MITRFAGYFKTIAALTLTPSGVPDRPLSLGRERER